MLTEFVPIRTEFVLMPEAFVLMYVKLGLISTELVLVLVLAPAKSGLMPAELKYVLKVVLMLKVGEIFCLLL